MTYVNCGDWVDSCTAIIEHFDGRLELVTWGLELESTGTQSELQLPHRIAGSPIVTRNFPLPIANVNDKKRLH